MDTQIYCKNCKYNKDYSYFCYCPKTSDKTITYSDNYPVQISRKYKSDINKQGECQYYREKLTIVNIAKQFFHYIKQILTA